MELLQSILKGIFLLISTTHYVAGQCAVTGVIVSSGPCDYEINGKMEFYASRNYTQVLDPISPITINTYMYLRVEMFNASFDGVNLLVETCWATKTIDHTLLLYNFTIVEFPGCSFIPWRNVINIDNNGLSKVVTVSFPNFYLYPNEPEFYVHCTIGTCDGCVGNSPDECTPEPRTYTRTAKILTLGPIRRETTTTTTTSPTPTALISQQTLLIIIIILAVLVFLLIVLIIACLLYPKCEKAYMKKAAEKGYNTPVLTSTINHFYEESPTPSSDGDPSPTPSDGTQPHQYTSKDGSIYSSVTKSKQESTIV